MAECWGTAQEGAWAGIMLEAYEVTREQGAILATEGDLQEREVGLCQASQRATSGQGPAENTGPGLQQAGRTE